MKVKVKNTHIDEKIKQVKKNKKSLKKKKEEKVDNLRNATFDLVEVIVIVMTTIIVAGVSVGIVVYKNYDKIDETYNMNTTTALDRFIDTYNNVLNTYVEELDEEKLISAAIEAIFDSLDDPNSDYLSKEESDSLQEKLDGSYNGIGIEITKHIDTGEILVITVFDGSPAEKAGIKKGDLITKVDGVSVVEKTASEIATLIKEKSTQQVEIVFKRDGVENAVILTLSNIIIPSVKSENFDGIGYVQISTFSNNAIDQVKEALTKLESEGITGLVIDVRGNTGGYLTSAIDISELFIEKGKIIYQLESKNITTEVYKDKTKDSKNYKIAVLIDGGSASASEILAAALKESYGATLVGTTSYGKGTVQTTDKLSTGEMIKYTTSYWLTPNGNNINKVGLTPDIYINYENTEEYSYEKDNQLQVAIEAVK